MFQPVVNWNNITELEKEYLERTYKPSFDVLRLQEFSDNYDLIKQFHHVTFIKTEKKELVQIYKLKDNNLN
jgi:hypothetical protein